MKLPYKLVGSFKGLLFILALLIVLTIMYYTDGIVSALREDARSFVNLKVERFRSLFQQGGDSALNTYLTEMQAKDFPLIVSDRSKTPLSWSGIPELESMDYETAQDNARLYQVEWQRQGNQPVPINIPEYGLTFYFYYGDSDQIRRLRYLPWIEVGVVGALILIGYFGFVNIKRSEERSVWVGMARETAHQLGTPLTSLLGWIELLEEKPDDPQIVTEIKHDLTRLETITERFNQIGSKALLTSLFLRSISDGAVEYVKRRLPQLSSGGEVVLNSNIPDNIKINVNVILFGWLLENLLKNGIESLGGKGGKIELHALSRGSKVIIDISDTGHGIPRSDWRNVFRPGYTTKSRGWGLGLSLARRIIEDIHRGKIFIAESKPGKGTTIRIQLPI